MKIGELAPGDVIEVEPGRSIRAAAEVMWERKIGSVVVQRDGELAGILTERDVLRSMATSIDPDDTPVEELMTTDVFTATPDWDVYEAAVEMSASAGCCTVTCRSFGVWAQRPRCTRSSGSWLEAGLSTASYPVTQMGSNRSPKPTSRR
ncbi:MAG: CBS domain-containing protein [Actinobacteria bacterium]|nr:CBS domain-containing protein [Actinomycetota bacterium]